MKYIEIEDKIRVEQKETVKVISEYYNDTKEKNYALIKMPTGTGKTGVMASVALALEDIKILIVTPNSQLPNQIKNEVEEKFWNKIGINATEINLKAKIIKGIKSTEIKEDDGVNIYICTIQGILSISKENKKLYKSIKENIDLIIFDEGHREASDKWQDIIKNLKKKTVIFTATPYRNDNTKLKISNKHAFYLTFEDAISKGYIKNIVFNKIEDKIIDDVKGFCKNVYEKYTDKDKIIIRCNKSSNIKAIVNEINEIHQKAGNKEFIAVGVHSRFSDEDATKKDYSKEIEKNFNIFVHQNKMVEGIDIPLANKLILYNNFNNYISIIQQIGRIVRKVDESDNNAAHIYVRESQFETIKYQWNLYIEFDNKKRDVYNFKNIHKKTKKDEVIFVDGIFRRLFSMNSKEFYKDLVVPKSATLYNGTNIKLKVIIDSVKNKILNKTYIGEYKEHLENNFWVLCYEKYRKSNILKSNVYIENSLECVVLVRVEDTIFHIDSTGASLPDDITDSYIQRIESNKIQSLFDNNGNFKRVKTNNIAIGESGVFESAFIGNGLQNTPMSVTESLVACTSVTGTINNQRRELGIISGKVKDFDYVNLYEYKKWCELIYDSISDNINDYFNNFAQIVLDEEAGEATSIMLNLSDFEENRVFYNNDREVRYYQSQFRLIKNNRFYFYIDGVKIKARLFIIKNKISIRIKIHINNLNFKVRIKDTYLSLEEYINDNRFRIIFKNNLVYMNGYMFYPKIKFRNMDLDITSIGKRIKSIEELEKCKDEKLGNPTRSEVLDRWPNDSVFGVYLNYIDGRCKEKYHESIDYLICDDMGTEIADFISIDEENKKICLVHCKHAGAKRSAAKFQDVCGQALKNLGSIISTGIGEKEKYKDTHIKKWKEKWSDTKELDKGKIIRKVECDRIVKGKGKIDEEGFWNKYAEIISDPMRKVEIWIFVDLLSRKDLKFELNQNKPKEEISQIMWILHSTDEIVSRAGGTLKIICK